MWWFSVYIAPHLSPYNTGYFVLSTLRRRSEAYLETLLHHKFINRNIHEVDTIVLQKHDHIDGVIGNSFSHLYIVITENKSFRNCVSITPTML